MTQAEDFAALCQTDSRRNKKTITTPSADEMMEWLAIQIGDRRGTDLDPSPYLDMLVSIRDFINRRRNDKPDGSI